MNDSPLTLRHATRGDIDRVNSLIEAAIATWDLPERVKRLSLASYRYNEYDLAHADIVVAEDTRGDLLGVAVWEPADASDTPKAATALLLHGLYVEPSVHHEGIGTRLLDAAEQAARTRGFDGLLVKAQRTAEGFFIARGLRPLLPEAPDRNYPHRLWKLLSR